MKMKTAEEIGIKASNIRLPSSTTEHEVIMQFIQKLLPSSFVIIFFIFIIILSSLTQPFCGSYSGTAQVSRCQKKYSGLYGAREDNGGRHIAIQLGTAPSGLIGNPPPSSPHFYTL